MREMTRLSRPDHIIKQLVIPPSNAPIVMSKAECTPNAMRERQTPVAQSNGIQLNHRPRGTRCSTRNAKFTAIKKATSEWPEGNENPVIDIQCLLISG